MVPGIGGGELILIAVVALVVVGPKDLPKFLHKIGKMVGSNITPVGPSQTFEVKALLTPQPW